MLINIKGVMLKDVKRFQSDGSIIVSINCGELIKMGDCDDLWNKSLSLTLVEDNIFQNLSNKIKT